MLVNLNITHERRGQAAMVQVAVTLIISLIIGVIVINQLFIANIGPTTYQYRHDNTENTITYGAECNWGDIENTENENTWRANPQYDASALAAYYNVQALSWAGIGLMAISIIILAAVTILGIVRGGLGGGKGV